MLLFFWTNWVYLAFAVGVIGGMIFIACLFWSMISVAHKKDKAAALAYAGYIAQEEWRVKDGEIIQLTEQSEEVVLNLESLDYKRKHVVYFRPGHPDIEKLAQLNQYDFVKFRLLKKSMSCALEGEINGYLRLVTE